MKIELSKIFKYCPACGAKSLKIQSLKKHITCSGCGFLYFHNVASASGAIIEYKSRVLMLVRGCEPKIGMLDLPGGFADYGESAEDATKREIFEELGINVYDLCYLTSAPNVYLYENVTYPTLDLFFTCTIDNPRDIVASSDEVGSFKFFEPARIPLDKIAFESSRKALEFYINLMRQKRKRS